VERSSGAHRLAAEAPGRNGGRSARNCLDHDRRPGLESTTNSSRDTMFKTYSKARPRARPLRPSGRPEGRLRPRASIDPTQVDHNPPVSPTPIRCGFIAAGVSWVVALAVRKA